MSIISSKFIQLKQKMTKFKISDYKLNKTSLIAVLKLFLLFIPLYILTFPNLDWTFTTGIDPSLVWVFNYFAENGLSNGSLVIFPHGPLAFFMYPLPENINAFLIVLGILKFNLLFAVYKLLDNKSQHLAYILSFSIVYLILIIAPFNQLLLACLLANLLCYYQSPKSFYKYFSLIIVVFAFYVKSYVGILSVTIYISHLLYNLVINKKLKQFAVDIIVLIASLFIFRFLLLGTFRGFFYYLTGIFNLAQDNSSAAAYYPDNNWWILSVFILVTIAIPLTNRDKKSIYFGVIGGLSLFAAWKHGMAREDIYHVSGFLTYLIIVLLLFNLFVSKNVTKNLLLSLLSVILLAYNNTNAINYSEVNYKFIKSNNFIEFVTDYNNVKQRLQSESEVNISTRVLPDSINQIIKNSSLDIYPWDYSIIPANNLNWSPRPVIQSYASYTSWLDKQNANHFNSGQAPNYIIWHKVDGEFGFNGGKLNSLDNRYLLNDEPQTIISVLCNYKTKFKDEQYLLLEKRNSKLEVSTHNVISSEYYWEEWINVPATAGENTIIRAKLDFDKTFKQSLKSFLYKDEQFWILMELENGEIHKYRFVPKNARDGLWINPYCYDFNSKHSITKIMFFASNKNIICEKVFINFEMSTIKDYQEDFCFLGLPNKELPILNEVCSFDENSRTSIEYWSWIDNKNISEKFFTGNKSYTLKQNSFSPSFSINTDSIKTSKYRISANTWVYPEEGTSLKNIVLVISIDYPDGNNIWKGISLDKQVLNYNSWNNINNYLEINSDRNGGIIKAYLWNNSNKEVLLDDFTVSIIEI